MATKLYHYSIGFPENLVLPTAQFLFTYSKHAREQFFSDRYYKEKFTLPHLCFTLQDDRIVEIELEAGAQKLNKLIYRMPFLQTHDLDFCICILWENKLIKTLWFNESADEHSTLDKSKYCYP
jgi:hypothetical protein